MPAAQLLHDTPDEYLFAMTDCINIKFDGILEIRIDKYRVVLLTRTASFM